MQPLSLRNPSFSIRPAQDVPFRFLPCLVAGLSYYIALKVPEGLQRLELLKQQYDEAWANAAGADQERAAVRFVPRQMFIGGGT